MIVIPKPCTCVLYVENGTGTRNLFLEYGYHGHLIGTVSLAGQKFTKFREMLATCTLNGEKFPGLCEAL
jgi:adenosylmethionine-8-amino-7-oxononanoate aminotransferase